MLKTFNLNKTFRTIVVLIFLTLAMLIAVAVGLVIEADRTLMPLQHDTEALSAAEANLIDLLRLDDKVLDKAQQQTSNGVEVSGVLAAVDTLSAQVNQNLEDLATAQQTFVSLTHTTAGGILVLAAMLGATFAFFHYRVLKPIGTLTVLMRRLAQRDFAPEPLAGIDQMLHPVFESYNSLVNRLALLERANAARQDQLERRVQTAVGALVSQRAELARTEKLAAVGEVAAKMAHDIRNPLASIRAACNSLIEDVDDEDSRERLDLVVREVDRLLDIIRRQLDQARHTPEAHRTTDLVELINDLVNLADYQLPDNISLRAELARNEMIQFLPAEGLRRSLLNLILNARNALRDDDGEIRVIASMDEQEVRLVVEDTGPGFSEQILSQGVRHFATSTEGGTGLGLTMAKRYAEELSGRLVLENAPSGGARVVMHWPTRPPPTSTD